MLALLLVVLYLILVRAAVITLPLYKHTLLASINHSEHLQLTVEDWYISDDPLFPDLVFDNATLVTSNVEQTTFELQVKELVGRVDLLRSLKNFHLVFKKLNASDAVVQVNIKPSNNPFDGQGLMDLLDWLEKQSLIELKNISWEIQNGSKSVSQQDWSALWAVSADVKHFSLQDGTEKQVYQSRYAGEFKKRKGVTGQSYFFYDIKPFLELLPTNNYKVAEKAEIEGWLTFYKGNMQLVAKPNISEVNIPINNHIVKVKEFTGLQYANLNVQDDLKIEWRDVSLNVNEQTLKLDGLTEVSLSQKQIERVYIEHLDLQAIMQLVKPFINTQTVTKLESLAPSADIKDIHVFGDWHDINGLAVVFDIENAQARLNAESKISNLSGRIFWQDSVTTLLLGSSRVSGSQVRESQVTSKKATFDGAIFDKPITANVSGAVRLVKDSEGSWQLSSNELQLSNSEVDATLTFSLTPLNENTSTSTIYLSMDLTIEKLKGAVASNYIPLELMKDSTAKWLRNAFVDGEVAYGKVLFEGDLQSRKNSSLKPKILIGMWSDDASLRVSPSWPLIENVDAYVQVDGPNTNIYLDSAEFAGMTLGQSKISIEFTPGVGSILTVPKTKLSGDMSQAWSLFEQSAFLRKRIPDSVKSWQTRGAFSGTFAMTIPLRKAEDAHVVIDTQVTDGNILLTEPSIALDNVSGVIVFDSRTGLTTKGFRADLWQGFSEIDVNIQTKPFELSLHADYFSIDAQSVLQDLDLAHLPITGTTSAHMDLSIPYKGAPLNLVVTSAMEKVSMNLPMPFKKPYGVRRPYTIEFFQDGDVTQTNIHDGAHNFTVQSKNKAIEAMRVSFNQPRFKAQKIASGYYADGTIDELSVPEWQSFLKSVSANSDTKQTMTAKFKIRPLKVDVSLGQLELTPSLSLSDTALVVNKSNNRWSAAINSNKIAGVLSAPMSLIDNEKVLVDINLSKFKIAPDKAVSVIQNNHFSKPYVLDKWHDANIKIDQLLLDDTNLGNISFKLRTQEQHINLENISGNIAGFKINASGSWKNENGIMLSSLEGTAKANDLRDISSAFSKPVFGKNGATTIEYKLFWPDLLQDFALKNATGSIYFNSEPGRFIEMENYAALRLLGVFNIANWQRRLRLDFKDLYQEGLPFDSIEGTFRLSKGLINTAYFNILGPSSQILMSGDINLNANTLDMNAEVVLPISKTLYAGCLIGLPACAGFFAVERAFGGGIEQAAAVNYELSGSFLEPQFKRKDAIKRKVSTANPLRKSDLESANKSFESLPKAPVKSVE